MAAKQQNLVCYAVAHAIAGGSGALLPAASKLFKQKTIQVKTKPTFIFGMKQLPSVHTL